MKWRSESNDNLFHVILDNGTTAGSIYATHESQADADAHVEMLNRADPTTIQSLILSKDKFKTVDAAKGWAKKHNFKTDADETDNSYRMRQREPSDFKDDSFRTIELTDGVKAVIGHLKSQKEKSEPRRLYRYLRVEPTAMADDGTFQVAISSEFPGEQRADMEEERLGIAKRGQKYIEVLSHKEGDVDLSQLNNTGAFLDEHLEGRHLGNVNVAKLSQDNVVRGVVKFDKASRLSKTRCTQMRKGSRPHISVGYVHTGYIGPTTLPDGTLAHKFSWAAKEVSSVGVPMDPTVGLGRSKRGGDCRCIRCGMIYDRSDLDDQYMCDDCVAAEEPADPTEEAAEAQRKAEELKQRGVDYLKSANADAVFAILPDKTKTELQRKFMADPVLDIDQKTADQIRADHETKVRKAIDQENKTRLEAASEKVRGRNAEIHALADTFCTDYHNLATGTGAECRGLPEQVRSLELKYALLGADADNGEVRRDFKREIDALKERAHTIPNPKVMAEADKEVGSQCQLMRSVREIMAEADKRGEKSTALKPFSGPEKDYNDEFNRQMRNVPGGSKLLEKGGFTIPNSARTLPYSLIRNKDGSYTRRSATNLMTRDALAFDFATVGAFIQPQFVLPIIELLRNRIVVDSLGATFMGGLMGDVVLPRQEAATTAQSLAEGAQLNPFDQVIGQVRMTPKRVGSRQYYSRLALIQSTPDFEAFVRDDHFKVIAIYMDEMALNGSGNNDQPIGILNQLGINQVVFGGTPTYASVVNMRTQIRKFNVVGPLGFTTTSVGQGRLCVLPETLVGSTVVSGSTAAIWKGDELDGTVLGARAIASQQVPGDILVVGVWSQLIVGQWGGINVVVDNYTRADRDEVALTLNTYMDTAVRHPQAFTRSADSANQ